MKRMVLACSAWLAIPLLSGCCGCGGQVDPCCGYAGGGYAGGGYSGGSYTSTNYGECLPAYGAHRTASNQGTCSSCEGDGGFALPPATSGPQPTPSTSLPPQAMQPGYHSGYTQAPAYDYHPGYNYPPGAFPVGPETVGPEVVTGPAYGQGESGWTYQAAPSVPVTPAYPYSTQGGPSALLPPSPIPSIPAGNVVPPPAAQPAGPLMPPVPPPPSEPVSQMRYRRYR